MPPALRLLTALLIPLGVAIASSAEAQRPQAISLFAPVEAPSLVAEELVLERPAPMLDVIARNWIDARDPAWSLPALQLESAQPPAVRRWQFPTVRRYVCSGGLSVDELLREAGQPIDDDYRIAARPRGFGAVLALRGELE